MTRQNLGLGSFANDGSGDTLRQAGQKINDNFIELYQQFGGDSNGFNLASGAIKVNGPGLSFEGDINNGSDTILKAIEPTATNQVTIPNASGQLILDSASQSISNKTISASTLSSIQLKDNDSSHNYNIVTGALTANHNLNVPSLSDSDTFVLAKASQTLTNKTITSPSISGPSITGNIEDANNAAILQLNGVVSAVNYISIGNNATGSNPTITPAGTDPNQNLDLLGKGTGTVNIEKASYSAATITADGAADALKTYIICNSATALAVSLADGTVVGEYKIFTNNGAGTATVTPTNFAQGTTFALAQYDGCQVVWDGSNWYLIGNQGELTVA